MSRRQFVVLGLGVFGSSVVKTLCEYGCEVLAIDNDMENVQNVAEYATQSVQADMENLEQLKHLDIGSYDVAIIGTGSNLESAVMAIMNLKELGVPYIVAKAKNKSHMQIFKKLGVDLVVRPEKEMGERIAKMMLSKNIIDLIEIDEDYSIVEISAPQSWVGKTLVELNVRGRYGMNVIAVRYAKNEMLTFSPDPKYVFENDDQVMVITQTSELKQFNALEKLK